jgi:hypothetical protein
VRDREIAERRVYNGTPSMMTTDWRADARSRLASKLLPQPVFLPEAFPSLDSYQERLRRRKAHFSWCIEQDFEFLVTLQFGKSVDQIRVESAMKKFGAVADDYWLPGRRSKYLAAERTFFVGAVEEGPRRGNTHVHLLLRRPRYVIERTVAGSWREQAQARCLTVTFSDLAHRKGICHGGVRFDRLRDETDQMLASSYVLKDQYRGQDLIWRV